MLINIIRKARNCSNFKVNKNPVFSPFLKNCLLYQFLATEPYPSVQKRLSSTLFGNQKWLYFWEKNAYRGSAHRISCLQSNLHLSNDGMLICHPKSKFQISVILISVIYLACKMHGCISNYGAKQTNKSILPIHAVASEGAYYGSS